MLKIAVIGTGMHCRDHHLPSLKRLAAERPGELELSAVCDIDENRARQSAEEFGFARAYMDMEQMLAEVQPGACLAITPIAVTRDCVLRLLELGISTLIEKPPGASVEQAREIVAVAERAGVVTMVSMNRRYDPVLSAGLAWIGDRKPRYIRGSMVRINRREPDFHQSTGIHALDCLRHLGGDITGVTRRTMSGGDADWLAMDLVFDSGAQGTLELLPTSGIYNEEYELLGDGWRVCAHSAWFGDGRLICCEGNEVVVDETPAAGEPECLRSGSHAETEAFVDAVLGRRPPYPTPPQVLQRLEIGHGETG